MNIKISTEAMKFEERSMICKERTLNFGAVQFNVGTMRCEQ